MRKQLSELDIHNYFYYERGQYNAITDIEGIKVGHCTLIEGTDVRTGVTVIIPPNLEEHKYIAGGFAFNANGEVMGFDYIMEEAKLISPIFMTNTLSVGDVFNAIVDYYGGKIPLPIIGECWDGWLNDINGRHVKKEHVIEAIESAKSGVVEQGCIGAGTGMTSFGFKAGIGTSSRKLNILGKEYKVGVLVNNNMGIDDGRRRYFRIGGVDVARVLGEYRIKPVKTNIETHQNSSILTIATDIPLTHHQLNRLAKHAILGIGRLGYVSYSGSGDFVLAFSTANKIPNREVLTINNIQSISESLLDNVFEALLESVEEAYLNSILTAESMNGFEGHTIIEFPVDKIIAYKNGEKG